MLVVYVDQQGGTATLDRVRLLRSDVEVYDSGTGLGVVAQGSHIVQLDTLVGAVAADDRWSVEVTRSTGTGDVDCVAYLGSF